MKDICGVVTGLVKSLEDPDKLGRVQVTFKWMSEEEPSSNWARIAAPMAGGSRGVQFMPEIEDEVLLAFEHGNQRFPYIVGYLWNGEDKQPREESPALRTIETVSGHYLEFDDTKDSEKISILFKGDKPSVVIEEKKVNIETADGHLVSLDDEDGIISLLFKGDKPRVVIEEKKVNIETADGHLVSLDDEAGTISLLFKGDKPSLVIEDGKISLKVDGDDNSITLESDSISLKANSSNSIEINSGGVQVTGTAIDLN